MLPTRHSKLTDYAKTLSPRALPGEAAIIDTASNDMTSGVMPSASAQAMVRLTGGVAHDLNNLLQTVSGNLELLGGFIAGNTEAEEIFARIAGSATRGGELTRHVAEFCLGQDGASAEQAELGRVLDLLRDLLPRALGAARGLTFRFPPAAGCVRGHAGRIGLCILDLAMIIADACPSAALAVAAEHRVIDMDTPGRRAGAYVLLSVVARTAQAPAALGERLVAHARRSGHPPSIITGPDGVGVQLWLPRLVTPRPKPVVPSAERAPQAPLVLLVDDGPDVLITLSAFLEGEGCAVVTARHGRDALAALASGRRFDVLVTDYAMPGMDGVELLRRARTVAPGLPGILVTGRAACEELAALCGPAEVLRKPFRRDYLVSRVKALAGGGLAASPPHASPHPARSTHIASPSDAGHLGKMLITL